MSNMPDGIEGRDFFYDRAKGEHVSCPYKCDLPTSYPLLCGEKCYDYIPKLRSTPTPIESIIEASQSLEWYWIFVIVLVVCLIVIHLTVFLMYSCRRKLHALSSRLREMFCERLVTAVPETRTEMTVVNGPLLNGQGEAVPV